jgi:hypothetical protein
MLPLMFMLAATGDPGSAPGSAEHAMANYRAVFTHADSLSCRAEAAPDQVVVCGRRGQTDPHRLPLPVELQLGDRTRLIPGEPPRATPALRHGQPSCSTVGPNQRCSGGLPVFQVIYVLSKAVEAVVDPDD